MSGHILYIDDDLDTGRQLVKKVDPDSAEWPTNEGSLKSSDEIIALIKGKSLILMDYDLHDADQNADESNTAIDGLELLERIRAATRNPDYRDNSMPCLVIYTGKFSKMANAFGRPKNPAFYSSLIHADWIIEKGKTPCDVHDEKVRQLRSLTAAFEDFDRDWKNDALNLEEHICRILGLDTTDQVWKSEAFRQFRELRPPLQGLIDRNDGAGMIRWLLNIALSFPSCFLDDDDMAVALGFDPVALGKYLAEEESALREQLSEYRYEGALSDFFGNRYWKAGIEDWIWKIRGGSETQDQSVLAAWEEIANSKIPKLQVSDPVLVIDPTTFEKLPDAVSMNDAVQVQPDYWPVVLEAPWVRIDEIRRDNKLKSLVIDLDLDKIKDH